MSSNRNPHRKTRALYPGVTPHQYHFKEHPDLRDKLDMICADLLEDGIKAKRSDVLRALVMTQLDNAFDVARDWLGGEL